MSLDSHDVPLREWLSERFDAIDNRLENLEKVLVIGNGQASVVQRMTTAEGRLNAHESLIAYDRSRIDILRDTPKKARVAGTRWGAFAGGLVSVLAAAALAVLEALNKR